MCILYPACTLMVWCFDFTLFNLRHSLIEGKVKMYLCRIQAQKKNNLVDILITLYIYEFADGYVLLFAHMWSKKYPGYV